MYRPRVFVSVLSLLLVVACMAEERADDSQSATAAGPSEAFLDSVLTAFTAAMRAKDPAPVMTFYADNAVSYSPNADPLTGKAAIGEYNKQWFASLESDSLSAQRDGLLSSGDLAVETGLYYFKGKMFGQAIEDRGRYLNVWQRQSDGSWKIVRDMANSSLPLPGTQPPAGASKK